MNATSIRKYAAGLAVGVVLAIAGTAVAQVVKRYQGTHVFDKVDTTTLAVGGTNVTSTAAELNYNDVTTAGTAQASKSAVLDASKGITGLGIVGLDHLRPTNASELSAADVNLTVANIRAASFWPVKTSGNAVDVDFGDDAALASADIGSLKVFVVTTGHATQALTVTEGASGVTTIKKHDAGAGTSCEDVGDMIACIPYLTTAAVCRTYCAD